MKNSKTNFTECWSQDNMERINEISDHPLWKLHIAQLKEAEKDRIFCKHGIEHLLDVARIAYIENLEENCGISKEMIYAAALLHDIGRFLQYSEGISHEEAGEDLAEKILEDCGFQQEEKREIISAIASHRNVKTRQEQNLAGLIYRADKQSRVCKFCPAFSECNWSMEKKNNKLKI